MTTEIPQTLRLLTRQGRGPWWREYGDLVPDWLQRQLILEQLALSIHTYDAHFVPALLQTPDYARAVNAIRFGMVDLDRRVELSIRRQKLWLRHALPKVWTVIDEAALRRPLGGVDVMRVQIQHLIELAELDHVTIQICPISAAAQGPPWGPVTLLRLLGGLPQAVYLEYQTGINFLLNQDIGHYRAWLDRAILAALPSYQTPDYLAALSKEL